MVYLRSLYPQSAEIRIVLLFLFTYRVLLDMQPKHSYCAENPVFQGSKQLGISRVWVFLVLEPKVVVTFISLVEVWIVSPRECQK